MAFHVSGKYFDLGLLILRVGIGVMMILHGAPKMFGGPEKWETIGAATQHVGIHFAPMFFGFMAALAEFFGGILLLFGLYFGAALVLLIINMAVAASYHLGSGDGLMGASHAIELGILFLSLLFIGPGLYSLDHRMKSRLRR